MHKTSNTDNISTDKQPALVGVVPKRKLWPVIQEERWYHIPVKSAPNNAALAEFIAFYFPKVFGWHVLRFSGREIYQTITNLGGLCPRTAG